MIDSKEMAKKKSVGLVNQHNHGTKAYTTFVAEQDDVSVSACSPPLIALY